MLGLYLDVLTKLFHRETETNEIFHYWLKWKKKQKKKQNKKQTNPVEVMPLHGMHVCICPRKHFEFLCGGFP